MPSLGNPSSTQGTEGSTNQLSLAEASHSSADSSSVPVLVGLTTNLLSISYASSTDVHGRIALESSDNVTKFTNNDRSTSGPNPSSFGAATQNSSLKNLSLFNARSSLHGYPSASSGAFIVTTNANLSTSMPFKSFRSAPTTSGNYFPTAVSSKNTLQNLTIHASSHLIVTNNFRHSIGSPARMRTPSLGPKGNKTLGRASPTSASNFIPASLMNLSLATGHARKTGAPPASITSLPKPISFLSGTPIYPLNATLPPQLDHGIMSLSDGGICRMGQTCETCTNYNAQSCSCANSVSNWFYGNNRTIVTTRQCYSYYYGKVPGSTQPQTCSLATITSVDTPFHAPKQCCDKCDIRANEVQVIFWPDTGVPAILGNRTNSTFIASLAVERISGDSTLVSDGHTFISPSVYINYKSLQASVSCVTTLMAADAWTKTGRVYNTIRPYAPDALSSARCLAPAQDGVVLGFIHNGDFLTGIFNGWEALHYQGLRTPPPSEELISRYQTCFPQLSTNLVREIAAELYANPRLSIPGDVTDIDPLWQIWGGGTCTPVGLGAIDPPRVLRSASAMATDSMPPTAFFDTVSIPTSIIPASPAARPTNVAEMTRPQNTPTDHPSIYASNSDLEPISSTKELVSIIAIKTLVLDPITTIDPNDPALVGVGKYSRAKPPGPIYESAMERQLPGQSPGPTPEGNSQMPQALPAQSLQGGDVQHASVSPDGDGQPKNAAFADPNSVPITLVPSNAIGGPQSQPITSQGQIAHFVAQAFLKDPLQPPLAPDSQPQVYNQPAYNFGPVESGIGNVRIDHDTWFKDNQVVQSSNGRLKVGGQDFVPGSQTTVSGHVVEYPDTSVVIADGTTYHIAPISTSNPLVVGDQSLQRGPGGAIVIADSTVQPDQQATVSGHVISLAGSSNLVVDQSIYVLPPSKNAYLLQAQPTPISNANQVFTADSQIITPGPAGFVVGGASIAPGGPPAIIHGTPISLDASSHLYIGPSIMTLERTPTPSAFNIGSQMVTPAPKGFTVAGTPIVPGGPAAFISGTKVSLDASSHLYVGSSTMTLTADTPQTALTVGSSIITPAAAGFAIVSMSIYPNGPAVTFSGTVLSLDAASHLRVGSTTISLESIPSPTPSIFTVGPVRFTANPLGFTVADTTITPGGPGAIIAGTSVSLDTYSHLYIGSSIATLVSPPQTQSVPTIGSQTFTAKPSGFQIGTMTFTPGGSATAVAGTLLSLGQNGLLVLGNSTIMLPTQTAAISSMANGALTAVPETQATSTNSAVGVRASEAVGVKGLITSAIQSDGVRDEHKNAASRDRRGRCWMMVWAVLFLISLT